jgi:hypothetical protein
MDDGSSAVGEANSPPCFARNALWTRGGNGGGGVPAAKAGECVSGGVGCPNVRESKLKSCCTPVTVKCVPVDSGRDLGVVVLWFVEDRLLSGELSWFWLDDGLTEDFTLRDRSTPPAVWSRDRPGEPGRESCSLKLPILGEELTLPLPNVDQTLGEAI